MLGLSPAQAALAASAVSRLRSLAESYTWRSRPCSRLSATGKCSLQYHWTVPVDRPQPSPWGAGRKHARCEQTFLLIGGPRTSGGLWRTSQYWTRERPVLIGAGVSR